MQVQEIQDKIFLELGPFEGFETLERTRELQSQYVQNCTKFNTYNEAILNNHVAATVLDNVKWLKYWSCPFDEYTSSEATTIGNLELLKYLHEVGCPINQETMHCAIRFGDLEIIKYLHIVTKCYWNSGSFWSAICKQDLNIIKYLHDNGCEWSPACTTRAIQLDNKSIINYLSTI